MSRGGPPGRSGGRNDGGRHRERSGKQPVCGEVLTNTREFSLLFAYGSIIIHLLLSILSRYTSPHPPLPSGSRQMQAVILMRQLQAPDIGMAGSGGTAVSRSKVKETENQGNLDTSPEALIGFARWGQGKL